jgi:pyruvate dehydrogenase E1 component
LAEQFDVSVDVWSATSYKLLRGEALRVKRWNMLHPTAPKKSSYLETTLQNEEGVFVAVSDYMKIVPDQIAPWVPGGLMSLGTDGFGRSDTRETSEDFSGSTQSHRDRDLYALYQKGRWPAKNGSGDQETRVDRKNHFHSVCRFHSLNGPRIHHGR